MAPKEALTQKLADAILACDANNAAAVAQEILDAGIDPIEVLNTTVAETANEVGERFESGEFFLPHLVLAGNAIEAASNVLQKGVPEGKLAEKKVIVIGTVEGDMHSLGKNIVAMMLRASGFEVHDLGVDVKSSTFIRRAQEVNADLIGLSCLMTTTLPYQREVIEDLVAQGLRDRFKVIVGGGPVTSAWAEEIGADGYGADVTEAVKVAKMLVGLQG
ncbi:MAG: corrinoid protein [Chloroflexi bacterium]|nr:corrinoid protein [Chloroflexota bacterium]